MRFTIRTFVESAEFFDGRISRSALFDVVNGSAGNPNPSMFVARVTLPVSISTMTCSLADGPVVTLYQKRLPSGSHCGLIELRKTLFSVRRERLKARS